MYSAYACRCGVSLKDLRLLHCTGRQLGWSYDFLLVELLLGKDRRWKTRSETATGTQTTGSLQEAATIRSACTGGIKDAVKGFFSDFWGRRDGGGSRWRWRDMLGI